MWAFELQILSLYELYDILKWKRGTSVQTLSASHLTLEPNTLGLYPSTVIYQVCELGHVSEPHVLYL